MKKRFITIAILGVLLVIGGIVAYKSFFIKPLKKVHYHAGFHVYNDGKRVDFSSADFMHKKPCTINKEDDQLNEQEEKAHLHDFVGDIVHVHREPAYWSDLFINLKYKIDFAKGIEGYINGKKVDNIMFEQIKPYDKVVIFIGKHGDVKEYMNKLPQKNYIQEKEKLSEGCGV